MKHPDILGHKFAFEEGFIDHVRPYAWFGSMSDFGDFWRARNAMSLDVARHADQLEITLDAPLPIDGLTLRVPDGLRLPARGVPSGFRQNRDHIVLPRLEGTLTIKLEPRATAEGDLPRKVRHKLAMKSVRVSSLLLAGLAFAGCEAPQDGAMSSADMLAPAPMARMETQVEAAPDTANPSALSFMAYRYAYSFELPGEAVAPTLALHRDRCLDAGPSRCLVLSSRSSSHGEDATRGHLHFRAEPDFLVDFEEAAQTDVETADGERTSYSMNSEDLTRQYLDTDARLTAQTALRNRLQSLLETRDAELADLLAVEQELARVQAQIESATTTLEVLRKRVSMSEVTFEYRTKGAFERGNPVGDAFANFGHNIGAAFAAIVVLASYLLPWLVIGIPLVWLTLRAIGRVRRRNRTKTARPSTREPLG